MNWLVWSLLAAVFAGATAVLAKAGVTGVNSHLATAVRTAVVLVFTSAIAASSGPVRAVLDLSARTWLMLVLSGVATGLSWLCYFRALQLGPASKVAPVDKLSVVFVVAFAALFLGEPVSARSAVGAALIALGSVVLATA